LTVSNSDFTRRHLLLRPSLPHVAVVIRIDRLTEPEPPQIRVTHRSINRDSDLGKARALIFGRTYWYPIEHRPTYICGIPGRQNGLHLFLCLELDGQFGVQFLEMELASEPISNSPIAETGSSAGDAVLDDPHAISIFPREPPQRRTGKARCLWCGRAFTPRTTGGSAQRFCSTAHRQSFWVAARRWTMRAIETGLLSVECLKAIQPSVHADRGAFPSETNHAA
jgi:hypothetical protein